jgi:regulator of PEP synthase PpsR (kinase-PPPase family)
VNNKSHLNRVGSSILAIIRAMTYSPDNVNYKNFKKYFPKNFNSKLIQKKLKQFHSQNDKVQVTLVTQAIKNELGAGVNEEKLTEQKFKKVILPNDMKTKVKVSKIIKKMKLKIDKDYDVKALKARGGDQELLLLPKHYNKFIELAMQNKLNPRG